MWQLLVLTPNQNSVVLLVVVFLFILFLRGCLYIDTYKDNMPLEKGHGRKQLGKLLYLLVFSPFSTVQSTCIYILYIIYYIYNIIIIAIHSEIFRITDIQSLCMVKYCKVICGRRILLFMPTPGHWACRIQMFLTLQCLVSTKR